MTAPSLPKIPTEIFQNAEDRFEFETHGAPFKAVRKDLVANGSIIVPPKPQYPPDLIEEGAEAYCEVRFDVQPEGKTENVVAACTDKRFIAEAVRAIEVWKAPAIRFRAGYAITAHNVIYPIQFCRSYDNAVEGGS